MKIIRPIVTCCLIQILFFFSIVSPASGSDVPKDARLLLEKREAAVKAIDQRFVEELKKLKVAHTKRGDLESANAIVELINKYETEQGIAKHESSDESSQIARLVGVWKRDVDGNLFQFNADGSGIFANRNMFQVTYNPQTDQFEVRSPHWELNTLRFDDTGTILIGYNSGGAYKLTRTK
jgi:hypothetical protein